MGMEQCKRVRSTRKSWRRPSGGYLRSEGATRVKVLSCCLQSSLLRYKLNAISKSRKRQDREKEKTNFSFAVHCKPQINLTDSTSSTRIPHPAVEREKWQYNILSRAFYGCCSHTCLSLGDYPTRNLSFYDLRSFLFFLASWSRMILRPSHSSITTNDCLVEGESF